MEWYYISVAGLNFVVDLLLLLAVNKLDRRDSSLLRAVTAAVLGGGYAALCLQNGGHFPGNVWGKLMCLAAMSVLAFGLKPKAVKKGSIFAFFWMVMSGLAAGFSRKDGWTGVLVAALLALLYLTGYDRNGTDYLPVIIRYSGRTARLTALRDTGNLLRDPVTGQSVLIAGPDTAQQLLALTASQLAAPVETLAAADRPGLRLIPYSSIGQPGGLLLAMRFEDVTLGDRRGAQVVAFAPHSIGGSSRFQALAGGMA